MLKHLLLMCSRRMIPNTLLYLKVFDICSVAVNVKQAKKMIIFNVRFKHFSLFSKNKMLVIKAWIFKLYIRILNREDPDQSASSEAFIILLFHG